MKSQRRKKLISFILSALCALPLLILLLFLPKMQGIYIIISATVHEAGHIISARLLGSPVSDIGFGMGGAVIYTKNKTSGFKMWLIYISGALFNLVLAGALTVLKGRFIIPGELIFSNLLLAAFNLMPIRGLDGGEALRELLEGIFLPERAYLISKTVSGVFFFILWMLVVFGMMKGGGNLSLFCVLAVIFYMNYER